MKSKATTKFWVCYGALPNEARSRAKEAYQLFQRDPWHPSLHFKRVHSRLPVYSSRITKDYRAVGMLKADGIVWFWIGTHGKYDQLLKQMGKG